jgi:hypothetical protein
METKTIIRVEKNKENPYVLINKKILEDTNLSYQAKGMLAYLLSKPDDWKIYLNHLQNQSKNGRDSCSSIIKELISEGYMTRKKSLNEKKQFEGYTYIVFEKPIKSLNVQVEPITVSTNTGIPLSAKPNTEEPMLLYNDEVSIEELNNDLVFNDNQTGNIEEQNGFYETELNECGAMTELGIGKVSTDLNQNSTNHSLTNINQSVRVNIFPEQKEFVSFMANRGIDNNTAVLWHSDLVLRNWTDIQTGHKIQSWRAYSKKMAENYKKENKRIPSHNSVVTQQTDRPEFINEILEQVCELNRKEHRGATTIGYKESMYELFSSFQQKYNLATKEAFFNLLVEKTKGVNTTDYYDVYQVLK